MSPRTSDLRLNNGCTAEEAAAVVAALALRSSPPVPDSYAEWRRRRIEALRRTT
jgi:hypothetical protein